MRYDAKEFLRRRWHELHDTPRGMEARDFVRHMTGDPRPTGVQSPMGIFSLDLGASMACPARTLFSLEGRR